jgi:hypothetical protein
MTASFGKTLADDLNKYTSLEEKLEKAVEKIKKEASRVLKDNSGHVKVPELGKNNSSKKNNNNAKNADSVNQSNKSQKDDKTVSRNTISDKYEVPNKEYSSFNKMKSDLGSPGKGNAWHHIVEQSQIGKRAKFTSKEVNNKNNIVAIPTGKDSIHSEISRYYSSKQDFTNGKRVRDWLADKTFEEQFEFGKSYLENFGKLVETENGWVFIPNK